MAVRPSKNNAGAASSQKRAAFIPSKKGIFFTLTAILIIMLFMIYAGMQRDLPELEKSTITRSRVTSTNDFVKSIEESYLKRALYAITHTALDAIIDEMIEEGAFRRNLSTDFRQIVLNGTVEDYRLASEDNPIITNTSELIAEEDRLLNWLNQLTELTKEELNLESTYAVNDLWLEQSGPWTAIAHLNLNYTVRSQDIVAWNRINVDISVNFSILGFTDPYIGIHTTTRDGNGNIEDYERRTINRTNESEWTIPRFQNMVLQGTYIFEPNSAPSFFMRFENNTGNSSCCGIISLARGDWDTVQGDNWQSRKQRARSYVDYQYWSVACYEGGDNGGLTGALAENDLRIGDLYNITKITTQEPSPEEWLELIANSQTWNPDPFYRFALDEFNEDKVFSTIKGARYRQMKTACRPDTTP
ncbi:MAG TPA: hypothetical protein VJI75_06630 [Candidatus Nanoarchaeia archaeon]|nr:hypothetical protein [Candidatus Nanoarchaeia archaeon]